MEDIGYDHLSSSADSMSVKVPTTYHLPRTSSAPERLQNFLQRLRVFRLALWHEPLCSSSTFIQLRIRWSRTVSRQTIWARCWSSSRILTRRRLEITARPIPSRAAPVQGRPIYVVFAPSQKRDMSGGSRVSSSPVTCLLIFEFLLVFSLLPQPHRQCPVRSLSARSRR